MTKQEYPKPIQYPKRSVEAIRKPIPMKRVLKRPDRREERQLQVRIDVNADTNRFKDDPNHSIQSPEDPVINIDSADNIIQPYTVPASGGNYGQFNIGRYFIDTANNIMTVYHFDQQNLRWIKFVTRLRKDIVFPRPPVMTLSHNAVYVYGSRGRRYVRSKQGVVQTSRRQYISNRRYNNRTGTSGARRIGW